MKLVQAETDLTTENPGTLRIYPSVPAGPALIFLRWARSYILYTAHAAPPHPMFLPNLGEFPRHSHHLGQMILHQSDKKLIVNL